MPGLHLNRHRGGHSGNGCWLDVDYCQAGRGGAANTSIQGQRLKANMHPMRFMGPQRYALKNYNQTYVLYGNSATP